MITKRRPVIDVFSVVRQWKRSQYSVYAHPRTGIPERCFYHPAPLTRRLAEEQVVHTTESPDTIRPAKRKRTSKSLPGPDAPSSFQNDRFADAVPSITNQPGYLGPTSYSAILPKDEDNTVVLNRAASVASDSSDADMAHQHTLTKSMRTQMTSEVLRCLRWYPLIQETVDTIAKYGQSCIVSFHR